ncbi:MAG TPA: plastocyanin/azurin family copper-binding protein [Actinocrinis sp.]|uniref:cupredoxin domain-containing protein n=1 Tax=Actinocrinis sp. TaxID=1920516 RepID=UPI002D3E3422|nr:plastocyanin/azurin family copper-binding protein [Actinocrinis sp.]HZU56797.1 plastocyanin/azurin family copper-binding protein [Actinocrinis sp.]
MDRTDSESGTPPNAPAAAPSVRRPARALLLLGTAAAAASALLLAQAATHPEAARTAVAQGTTTLNVADAAATAATSATTIEIKNYAFAPSSATVATGVKVTWVNEDTVPHTVTSKSGPASFDSGQINPGASYSAIFMTAGTYSYYCIDHPQMVATITVTGGSGGGGGTPSSTPSTQPSSTPSGGGTGGGGGQPSSSPSASMSMPAPSGSSGGVLGSLGGGMSGSGSGCASASQVLLPLLQHIDATHLGESPGQQVQDLSNINQYVLTHTTLVENMLIPAYNSANRSLTGLLVPLLQHINATHLGESPGQQVNDLLNLDQYVLTHTTLIENMLIPTEGVLTGSC